METRNNIEEPNDNWAFESENNQWYFNADKDEEDYKKEEDADEADEDDDDSSGDWGTVDPLEHPGPPSDMDPSAPGSAV